MKRFVKVMAVVLILVCVLATATACNTVGSKIRRAGKIDCIQIDENNPILSVEHYITDKDTIDAALNELKNIRLERFDDYDEDFFNWHYASVDSRPNFTFVYLYNLGNGGYLGYSLALAEDGTVYFIHEVLEDNHFRIKEVFRSKPDSIDTDEFLKKYR
ncbi:MAG: hypothetical protein NC132_02535 [Corallococcus sp.]|nr:hypothetical protein [Corallococcus sp.]MCM1358985.1 hypothetical protein [Corallococcus sp.]MCM1394974.1 hypothetical protein [Corallococcus sp.]